MYSGSDELLSRQPDLHSEYHVVGGKERQGVGVVNSQRGIQIPRKEKALVAESDPVVMVTENHLRRSLG